MINQNIVSNIKIPQQLIVSKSIELGTPAKDAILGSLEFKETKNKTNIIKKTIKKGTTPKLIGGKKIKKPVNIMFAQTKEKLEEKWSQKYKNSIDCKNPKGFSQKAHCQGKKKHMKEEDTEIEKGEFKEATGASSAGQYSGPMFLAKDSKNWRGGKKPIYKGGKFVRVKKKCKNFPYCNQGDIKALKIWEDDDLTEAIKNVAKTKNIHENIVRAILLHEIEETIFKD